VVVVASFQAPIKSENKMKPLQATRTVLGLAPQAAATTARTANIDTVNCSYAKVMVPISAEANTNSTNVVMEILHADDTNSFTSLGTTLIDNTSAVVAVANVNLSGKGKTLQVKVTPGTHTTNGVISVGGIVCELQQGLSPSVSSTEATVSYA
jgi:hypothetical protein